MAWYDSKNIEQKNLGFAFGGLAASLVEEQLPDLRGDFPNYRNWDCEQRIIDGVLLVKFECKSSGIPSVGYLAEDVSNEILSAAGQARNYAELRFNPSLQRYFSREKLLFIVDLTNGGFDWGIGGRFIVQWINEFAVPYAIELNQKRVLRASPAPPQYSQQSIFQAHWVLECEASMSQGSAFFLEGTGLVTCEHVVSEAKSLSAFHASSPNIKFNVEVVKANKVLDLAVLNLSLAESKGALTRFGRQSELHDHVLVCGFPNYRFGDRGVFSPGVVIGSRQQSGVRRLLTNASIVRGMSGGAAVGNDNKVVGVCVTGADRLSAADDTEDKSIIPIDALDLL